MERRGVKYGLVTLCIGGGQGITTVFENCLVKIGGNEMGVKNIAVIGSGTMGRGVAYAAALAGFKVTLQDIKQKPSIEQKIIMKHLQIQVLKKDISQVNNVTL